MVKYETQYLGLTLKNPLVVGSSGLTNSVKKIIDLEQYGVGAVVLKSLFEEQINNEVSHMLDRARQNTSYPEAEEYIHAFVRDNSIQNYLELIREAKEKTSIPIIASISCVSGTEWLSFAKEMEQAGADALEINAFILPTNRMQTGEEVERQYLDILSAVKAEVKIPVAMKIGSQFTNLIGFVDKLYAHGAAGVVMFNRFYEPDIDLENLKLTSSEVFSRPADISQSLRWVGLVSSAVPNIDIAASTGIHDGKAVVKQLLAGATICQITSSIYLNGPERIKEMLDDVHDFMVKWNFKRLNDFRARLSYRELPNPVLYERAQFMKYFSNNKA